MAKRSSDCAQGLGIAHRHRERDLESADFAFSKSREAGSKHSGLRNVTAELGNAFDRRSLAAIRPRPTIAIVSGLFELFPENAGVLESLRGLTEALEPGGHLIYTNQPWHPQVEFIARVLRNREGERWIMRRRTTAEMDELVRAAGFEKTTMEVDEWGIFTVAVARRVEARLTAAGSLDGKSNGASAHS